MSVSATSISLRSSNRVGASVRPTSIAQLLLRAAQHQPRQGIHLVEPGQAEGSVLTTYDALLDEARCILRGLTSRRPRGAPVVLLLERPADVIPAFWGCVLGGYLPCPLAPIRNDPERWASHLAHVDALLEHPLVVTTGQFANELPKYLDTINLNELRACDPGDPTQEAVLDDPAILMLTSGSTGHSKAVVLTHGNLLSSMVGKAERQRLSASDVTLNWIAFDHVAALLEVHLVSQFVGAAQVHIEPAAILADPFLFLRLIDRYRVSLAFAPNFLLGQINAMLQSRANGLARGQSLGLDLSCLRHIVTGGEANVVATGRRFLELLASEGLARDVLKPAFGMTETSAASIYSHEFPDGDESREFASVGLPIGGFQMRIVDHQGDAVSADETGELQVRGPMVFARYYNNEKATRAAFTRDGWFRTGDLGRIENGRLNLVGRSKDSIIVSGVNYFSHELESALEGLEGIVRSCIAVFPTRPQGADTEQLVVTFATTFPLSEETRLQQLVIAVQRTTILLWGFRPALILPLPKEAFPKTSLGKIQRSLLRKRLEAGELASDVEHLERVVRRQSGSYVPPRGPTEKAIAEIFSELFGLDPRGVSATANFFDFGGTSLEIIKLKGKLEQQLGVGEIPLVHILQNPTVRALARTDRGGYDPLVPLQLSGTRTPLFCVHPGVGEVLIYIDLASYFANDRPFYALRAPGFSPGEKCFGSIQEMVETYVAAVRKRQPRGPYAIAGYSFGAPIAFEMAKLLESRGERVAFVGCIDETPFLAEPSRRLEGPEGPLHVAFLLGLINREQLFALPRLLREESPQADPCERIIEMASVERLAELALDLEKFRTWAAVSRSLVVLGQSYQPSGSVESMTMFYAHPLHGAKEDWLNDVRRWDRFARSSNRYIEVAGEHHSLMGKQNVFGFQSALREEIDRALGGL